MSYILEALKKSQAERQLGNAPTIHALPIDVTPHPVAGGRRDRLWLALAAGALLLAAVALLTWRQQSQPVQALAVAVPAAVAPAPVVQAAPAAPPAPAAVAKPAPAPVAPPALAAVAKPAPPPVKPAAPKKALVTEAVPPAPVALAAPAEEEVRLLRELPAEIQREVPPLAIGGYIYSKNPADRLLLIDKILRHEGETVGPGLTLEKLQRNGAVLNFRGYRYRVPY
jgi:general secretion pathway protein B